MNNGQGLCHDRFNIYQICFKKKALYFYIAFLISSYPFYMLLASLLVIVNECSLDLVSAPVDYMLRKVLDSVTSPANVLKI